MNETNARSGRRWRMIIGVLVAGIGIAVFAVNSWKPQRTPADEALEYILKNGKVLSANAQCVKLPILDITLKNELFVTAVSFPVARLTDEMVKQLVKLDSLESIVLLDANTGEAAPARKVALADLELAASDESIAELEKKFPGLSVLMSSDSESAAAR